MWNFLVTKISACHVCYKSFLWSCLPFTSAWIIWLLLFWHSWFYPLISSGFLLLYLSWENSFPPTISQRIGSTSPGTGLGCLFTLCCLAVCSVSAEWGGLRVRWAVTPSSLLAPPPPAPTPLGKSLVPPPWGSRMWRDGNNASSVAGSEVPAWVSNNPCPNVLFSYF